MPEAMDEKKYVGAVIVSLPGPTDPVLKPRQFYCLLGTVDNYSLYLSFLFSQVFCEN